MYVVGGLEKISANQSKNVWPTINNFKSLTDTLYIQISTDRLLANFILVSVFKGYKKNAVISKEMEGLQLL